MCLPSIRACKTCFCSSAHILPKRTTGCMIVIRAVQQRSEKELKKVLTAEDAPIALRVVLHDAATYDVATGKGGLNGSIVNR